MSIFVKNSFHVSCNFEFPQQLSMPIFNMGTLIFLFHKSTRPSQISPSRTYLYKPIKRYSQTSKKSTDYIIDHERAPSTADEFKRVAEEKAEEKALAGDQGVASQTIEKACDGTEEATIGDSKVESVKNKYKGHEKRANYHKTDD